MSADIAQRLHIWLTNLSAPCSPTVCRRDRRHAGLAIAELERMRGVVERLQAEQQKPEPTVTGRPTRGRRRDGVSRLLTHTAFYGKINGDTNPYRGCIKTKRSGRGPLAAQDFMKPQQPNSASFRKDYQNARRT